MRVAVRCRPLNPDEVKDGRGVVVSVDQLRGEVTVQVGGPEAPGISACHTLHVPLDTLVDSTTVGTHAVDSESPWAVVIPTSADPPLNHLFFC